MTNNAEKLLVKDSAWDALGVNSETFFQDFASGIYLDSRVPEDVVKNFDIIKKLVLFGYYVYEFIDVAAEKALITFEMALKLRYQELIGQPATLNLFELINWAASERLFEDDEELVHSARKLRNMAVHPAKFTLAGYLSFEIIQRIVDVINDMYDDLSLRKKRKEEEIRVNRVLTEFSKSGAILEIGGKRLIVFLSVLLHCDNKTSPLKYYVLFWPIFEAKSKK